jgi:hypothetical protein
VAAEPAATAAEARKERREVFMVGWGGA